MEVNYSPKAEGFKGVIVVSAPSVMQRSEYMLESGFEIQSDGTVTGGASSIKAVMKLAAIARNHVKSVALEYQDGSKYDSFDAIIHDPVCDPVVNELAMLMMTGLRPSKN
jgi:hypothetical protein